jgi:hypothetical protein
VTDQDVAAVARATAGWLAPRYGPRLVTEVEAGIYGDDEQSPPGQYVDPVALGSLIVSIAALGWQIGSDLVKRGEKPVPDGLAQRIRVERRLESDVTNAEEKIVEIVSIEVVKRLDDE